MTPQMREDMDREIEYWNKRTNWRRLNVREPFQIDGDAVVLALALICLASVGVVHLWRFFLHG